MRPSLKHLFLLVGLLLLAACQTSPEKAIPGDPGELGYSLEQVPELLEEAAEAPPAESASLMLDAIEVLLFYGEIDWAHNIITGMEPVTLADEAYARHQLLASRLAVARGSQFTAEYLLNEPRLLDILPSLPPKLVMDLREQRARVYVSTQEYVASIQERVLLDQLLADITGKPLAELTETRDRNQDALWETLMQLSYRELNQLQKQAEKRVLKGWYTLAGLSKNHQVNLGQQLALVDNWVRNWPAHPASLRLPADLQLLRDLVKNQPQQVALLLPLTGPLEQASIAIRDGFMAAYYNALEIGEPVADIHVYDTGAMDIHSAYDQALIDGAEAVIGPLEKENISELALRPDLPVPTLALNYAETPYGDVEQLYQFGLAIEDEAQQVAQQAWRDGHRRALIFAPDSSWGDRSVNTFWKVWQSLGGEVTRDYRFGGNDAYLGVIASALHIDNSKKRAQDIRRLLGQRVEFEPRRRQDIDMIFLVAHTQQARQIKPTLAFHYAGDIPVYATSQVYSGEDPASNQDMSGIRFTSLPWFFDEDSPERKALNRYASTAPSYQRLYALGADAFHLYPRLRQLREVSRAHYYGYTGALSLNSVGKIEREQIWAQFVGGAAQVMPTLREDDRTTRGN
jgi:outer membrane PBP1 activator LpoA protein